MRLPFGRHIVSDAAFDRESVYTARSIFGAMSNLETNCAAHEMGQTSSAPWTFLGLDDSFGLGDSYFPWATSVSRAIWTTVVG